MPGIGYGALFGDAPPQRIEVECRKAKMPAHGCTREMVTKSLLLKVDQILDHEIDPWRVDLLDSQPVALTVDGEELLFRHLRDIAFAYELGGGTSMVVCFHDGERPVSLVADYVEKGKEWSQYGASRATPHILGNVRPSDGDFREHLRRYLEMRIHTPMHAITACVIPRKARAVQLRGNSLIFDLSEPCFDTSRPSFTGGMFEIISLPFALDARINWVLGELRPGRPVVYGNCLQRALRGRAQDRVDVIVAEGALTHVLSSLGGAYSVLKPEVIFRREGLSYHVTCQQEHMTAPELFSFDEQYYQRLYARVADLQFEQYSSDRLHCVASNQIWGKRISFHDVSRDQTRQFGLARFGAQSRVEQLKSDGLTVIAI